MPAIERHFRGRVDRRTGRGRRPRRARGAGHPARDSGQCPVKSIKIGHVSPRTGPLAGFGEADAFIIEQVNGILSRDLQSGGKTYPVEIICKDSQSSTTRPRKSLRADPRATRSISSSPRQRPTPPIRSPTRPRSTRCPASPRTARGSPTFLAATAIPRRALPGPIISSGAWKTSSPRICRCGTAHPPTKSSAAYSPTMPTATPGAIRQARTAAGAGQGRLQAASIPAAIR